MTDNPNSKTEEFSPKAFAEEKKQTDGDGKESVKIRTASDLETVFDVPIKVTAVLGKVKMPIGDLIKLETGAILELDRKVGEAIDIYVNDKLIARGEVVMVENNLGITMTEIVAVD